MKTKTILIAAVMFFALSVAASAQTIGTSFTVASVPESFVACCGITEETGSITFTAVPGSPDSVTGTITVIYPVPVTNLASSPGLEGIDVESAAQTVGGSTGTAPTVSINSVQNIAGQGTVIINVGAGGIYPYSITLFGVRVNVSGACDGSVTANITSTGNLITAGETSVVVISNVKQALKNPTSTPITINAVTGDQSNTAVRIHVEENFLDAFGETNVTNLSQTVSKMIRLTVSKVPAGVTLSFPVDATNDEIFTLASSNGTLATGPALLTSANTPGAVYYRVTTDTDPTVLEDLDVNVAVTNIGPYPLSQTNSPVTFTAHIAPIGVEIGTVIPRYLDSATCETASAQILSIFGASTTLLIPYSVDQGGFGYQTGIAIANTTTDPGTAAMGFSQAVRQSGKVTFYFFPQSGDPSFSYSTTEDPTVGEGLDDAGLLPTGGLYTVMLSQILNAAGEGPDFSGYIFIITDFTNAHGEYFISDFEFFTHGALMLVVNNDDVGRSGPEDLDN